MQLNVPAFAIAEQLVVSAGGLGIEHRVIGGARVLDCGIVAPGSTLAGIGMAHVALAGLGEVQLDAAADHADLWPDCRWPVVCVASRRPVAACLAAQYAGWKVQHGKFFALASGPLRAAIGREEIFETIGLRERPDRAVGLLETSRLPPEEVCRQLAADAGVSPDRLLLLVARTASEAGTLQVVARSLETALHKLADLRFDLRRIRAGRGRAPLPPVPAGDDITAIGRTNDAILYGAEVVLDVTGDDRSLEAVGATMVSAASADHGTPFATLFRRAGGDFYALDPALFAPAVVKLVNVETGRTHRFGRLEPDLVAESFTAPGA